MGHNAEVATQPHEATLEKIQQAKELKKLKRGWEAGHKPEITRKRLNRARAQMSTMLLLDTKYWYDMGKFLVEHADKDDKAKVEIWATVWRTIMPGLRATDRAEKPPEKPAPMVQQGTQVSVTVDGVNRADGQTVKVVEAQVVEGDQ